MNIPERLDVNGKEYRVERFLGKGKGGYSYLASDDDGRFVLKQIHHEPCDYYQFGDKLASELGDYRRLRAIGIRMPALLDADTENERILKEYIEGPTVFELVQNGRMKTTYVDQALEMCARLYPANTNIDYFPTNFVIRDDLLYYIDYECNDYMEEWDFEHWGRAYWARTPEFEKYLADHST